MRKELADEYAMLLVMELIEGRITDGRMPRYAMLDELLAAASEDMKAALRARVRDNTLICHSDINGRIMFEFTPSK